MSTTIPGNVADSTYVQLGVVRTTEQLILIDPRKELRVTVRYVYGGGLVPFSIFEISWGIVIMGIKVCQIVGYTKL